MIKIPGSELALAKKRGAEHTLIDFVGEINDIYGGTTATNSRDHIDAPLTVLDPSGQKDSFWTAPIMVVP